MNLAQVLAARDTAGARYAAARTEFEAALVDLAGWERVLANRYVGLPPASLAHTLSGVPQALPEWVRHADYSPSFPSNLHTQIDATAASRLSSAQVPG